MFFNDVIWVFLCVFMRVTQFSCFSYNWRISWPLKNLEKYACYILACFHFCSEITEVILHVFAVFSFEREIKMSPSLPRYLSALLHGHECTGLTEFFFFIEDMYNMFVLQLNQFYFVFVGVVSAQCNCTVDCVASCSAGEYFHSNSSLCVPCDPGYL